MNLHVFNDAHGFFLNLAVKRILAEGDSTKQIFLNLNNKTIYRDHRVRYLKRRLPEFKNAIDKLPPIEVVTFYPLDYTGAAFLDLLLEKCPVLQVNWVFWGYEYYHRPGIYEKSLGDFSLNIYTQKQTNTFGLLRSVKSLARKIFSVPANDRERLDRAIKRVNYLYSFLRSDYENVHKSMEGISCEWRPICFLSIRDLTDGVRQNDEHQSPVEQKDKQVPGAVMIGHAASLTMNHAEIIQQLCGNPVYLNLFLPLEYGDDAYRAAIKKLALSLYPDRVTFLENRLDMNAYYQRISSIRFAVFNFRWQEALGNIIFLIWNGTKVFLQKESAVYAQFIQWGIVVASIEDDFTPPAFTQPLSGEDALRNKAIVEEILSEERIKSYWKQLSQ